VSLYSFEQGALNQSIIVWSLYKSVKLSLASLSIVFTIASLMSSSFCFNAFSVSNSSLLIKSVLKTINAILPPNASLFLEIILKQSTKCWYNFSLSAQSLKLLFCFSVSTLIFGLPCQRKPANPLTFTVAFPFLVSASPNSK